MTQQDKVGETDWRSELRTLAIATQETAVALCHHATIDFEVISHLQLAATEVLKAYRIVLQNTTGDYKTYLESDQWKSIRNQVLCRDNFTCQRCQDVWHPYQDCSEFHVHHLTYARRGLERLSDLQTLCPDCHKWEHNPERPRIEAIVDLDPDFGQHQP